MIAVLADIHANLQALVAVLEDADRFGVNEFWLLGDAVDYGANPNEVVEMTRGLNITRRVGGNHDVALFSDSVKASVTPHGKAAHEFTKATLSKDNAAWLKPGSLLTFDRSPEHGAMLTHGSPDDPYWGYVYPDKEPEQWAASIEAGGAARLFVGHSHLQFRVNVAPGREIVNPGSVGQPRNRNPLAQYALVGDDGHIDFRQVPYDVDAAAVAIRKAGLPDYLADRLFEGR